MVQKQKSVNQPNLNVGDTVFLYKPVLVPGQSGKLSRPWAGSYYITQKISDIHVKLRRVNDNKTVKNRVHINRLKLGLPDDNVPIDPTAPVGIDAIEPAILADSECIDANGHDNVPIAPYDHCNDTKRVPNLNNDENEPAVDADTMHKVEKVLKKK